MSAAVLTWDALLEHLAEVGPSTNAKISKHFGAYNVTRITALTAIMVDAGALLRKKEPHGKGYVYWVPSP